MSATLRIKIECARNSEQDIPSLKFVYVIESPTTTTIRQLITALQEFIVTQFGCEKMRLMQLLTDDGYLLMNHNICTDVLHSNEKLICVDMNQFVAKNRDTFYFEESWLKLEQHDASDGIEKSLAVGVNNSGKLYVYLWGGANEQELYLFNISELLAIALETHILPMKIPLMPSSEWFISAQWVRDSASTSTLFLVGSLKTGDDTGVQSKKLRINLNESTKTIEKGEVTSLSTHSKEDPNEAAAETQILLDELKKKIPPPSRTGPTIKTNDPSVRMEKQECVGDSPLRMSQGADSTVEMEQEFSARNGSFRNYITITDILISQKSILLPQILGQQSKKSAEKPMAIAQVDVQYQWHDGKWLNCQEAKIEIASAQQDGRRKIATSILNIEPDKLALCSIHAAILIKGSPNRDRFTRARAHKSLPQPLKLKIILTDNQQSKTCSLVVEQINDPLELMTQEAFLNDKQDKINELITFVYADDCEYEERIYTAIYIDKEQNRLVIGDNSCAFMDKTQIRTAQFNAKKERKTEEPIEFIDTPEKRAIALFDPKTFLLYAIRIELTTSTSNTVETVLLPLNKIK